MKETDEQGRRVLECAEDSTAHESAVFTKRKFRADKNETLKLICMNEVETTEISWLWYPYIPFGKITVIQGDPGDRKTTTVLAIAATVTTGAALPESKTTSEPMSVIFQTAEDGLGDTVKPRLVQSGANCERVIVSEFSPQKTPEKH